MPKEITDIKNFILKARQKDAKLITVKKNPNSTKFKIRCSKYLYSLTVKEADKAEKLMAAIPKGKDVKKIPSDEKKSA